jgi:aminobenzoyl-glutamate transport protein
MVAVGIILALVVWGTVSPSGAFRGEDGGFDPLYNSIVPLMFIIFFVGGLVFGIVAKTITGDKDVSNMMSESMATMGSYIVLSFVAAHLVEFFIWSNLGSILAISGAETLKTIGFVGIPLMVAFILFSSLINLIIGSASAKYAILAPIFVPMLMLMGYSPETTQLAYRIGDSYSNILTPLLAVFPADHRICPEICKERRDRYIDLFDAALCTGIYAGKDPDVCGMAAAEYPARHRRSDSLYSLIPG